MRCSDSEDASDGSSGHDSMALPLLCVQVYMDDYIVHNVWRILMAKLIMWAAGTSKHRD